MYVSCFSLPKDLFHLLISCPFASRVWYSIGEWLKMDHIFKNSILSHVEKLYSFMRGKIIRSRKLSVWLTTCWCLWLRRNNIIFNNEGRNVEETCYHIKLTSYNWIVLGLKSILFFIFIIDGEIR